jgi:hypothetical protein
MKREVNPIVAVVIAVVIIGVAVFAYIKVGAGNAPKKSNAELRQHRPAPKIPPLGGPPQ